MAITEIINDSIKEILKTIHPQAFCLNCVNRVETKDKTNTVFCKYFMATMPNNGWCCYGKEEKNDK